MVGLCSKSTVSSLCLFPDQIRTTLDEAGLRCQVARNCPPSSSESEFNVQTTLTSVRPSSSIHTPCDYCDSPLQFATWWVGLIIVTLIGGLGAILFCITGLCFCCCRCCGKCGGSKTQAIQDNMDCKAFTFTIILLLLLALLL